MSLPPGFLDELRTRTSLSQVIGRKVLWDQRKSNQGKGDMWAPCPFHTEKSASFHVDDRKGFYYCFGCHAKGDAISFIRETENVGFMEAVEILAREAGMPVPKQDPKSQEKADRRSQLAEVMEQAVQYFRLQLKTAAGQAARDYLKGRGLPMGTQDLFDIGFAPDARQGLFSDLTGRGTEAGLIIDAGLAAKPDDGGAPYDRFRGRIIFPIRDPRGRCIALGGRAMDPNARAKYLNSPETVLFDKGRSLYNQGPARAAAGKGQTLIVAEGYMDVIALNMAGFEAVVAPLGTAITEEQIRLLWRISPEPIIALDGDKAGLRAAMRVIDIALPLLEAGQSLRFAVLPEGMDPDDLIKSKGRDAMQMVLDQAQPMVRLLWQRETEGKVFDSPERKAGLDKSLRAAIKTIKDPSIRSHYGEDIKQMRWELFGQSRRKKAFVQNGDKANTWRPGRTRRESWHQSQGGFSETRASDLGSNADMATEVLVRESVILATLCLNPDVIDAFEAVLETLPFSTDLHRKIRAVLLRHADLEQAALYEKLVDRIGAGPLENLFALRHVKIAPSVRTPGNFEIASLCVAEELAKLTARYGAEREISEAMEDLSGVADEGLTWRLGQSAQARHRAERSENEDKAVYDVGDNGARMDRDERLALHKLLDGITSKKDTGQST